MSEVEFKILTGLAVCIYLAAMISAFSDREKRTYTLFGIGFALNLMIIGLKWIVADAPPLGTIYHVLTAASLAFFPMALLIRSRTKLPVMTAVLALSAVIPLVGNLFMTPPLVWKRLPILQSDWFIPHVMAYCVAYGLCLAAFILLCIAFMRWVFRKDDNAFSDGARLLILIAFPLLTFGLCSGAVWGDSAWGSYWGWDPKENWGLITWLFYVIYLHLSRMPNAKREAMLVHFLAFASLICTCFMVAYTRLGTESKHAYGS